MAIVTKRTIMSLYSDSDDIYSHQVRIVLAEKGVTAEIIPAKLGEIQQDLLALNPYCSAPTLIDRDLVLYDARIIMEYLDERFPHPPLLPVYPVARAEVRKMMYRIDRDWYQLVEKIRSDHQVEEAREQLLQSLLAVEPVFASKPYFLSDEFSLLDCVLGPLLWRLPQLGVVLPESSKPIQNYMKLVFQRDSFKSSLSDAEKKSRVA